LGALKNDYFCLETPIVLGTMLACSVHNGVMTLFPALVRWLFALRGELEAAILNEGFPSAERLTATGAFAGSVANWNKANVLFEEAKNYSAKIEAETRLAAAQYAHGHTRLATEKLAYAQGITPLADLRHRAQITLQGPNPSATFQKVAQ
jgi:hypothetical protein